MNVYCFVLAILVSFSPLLMADVRLPAVIGDNMVLQQEAEVKLWGWADPAEEIEIETGWGEKNKVVTNGEGKWICKIKTPKAGPIYNITFKGNNTLKITNVIVGEVWLCSGQSNMEMPMSGWDKQPIHGSKQDIANSTNSFIRLFTVKRTVSDAPLNDVVGQWVECSPETVKDFSAVGYYFGREINKETGRPVGLICSSWGGTFVQAWMCIDHITNDDDLSPLVGLYRTRLKTWEKTCVEAERNKTSKPHRYGGIRPQDKPSVLYNGMIAPINSMTIKGVIWYQGESNVNAGHLYRKIFPAMIKNWRCDFDNYSMPFYFVQLANFTQYKSGVKFEPYRGKPRESSWAELREAQLMTNLLRNTGMAVAIDIGETNNIHPGNKREVGERLAIWAIAKEYGKEIEFSGPLYQGFKIERDKIRIFFNHANPGLLFRDSLAKGFAIAGKDRKFVWADAKIDGETVVVFSEKVKVPVAVRYAWDIDPEISLYNKANLPASPFRTDDWNGLTYGNK